MTALAILIILFGALSVWQENKQMQEKVAGLDALANTPALLVDTLHRGVLPQLLIHLSPEKPIFAAEGRAQILALLAENFNLEPVEAAIPGMDTVYLLEKK